MSIEIVSTMPQNLPIEPPTKFVGLHSHSVVGSVFDAIGNPQEHIEFVRKNGGNALALTDHGNMNGFSHQYLYLQSLKSKGVEFKGIFGNENYFIPSIEEWKKMYEQHKIDSAIVKDNAKKLKAKTKAKSKKGVQLSLEEIGNEFIEAVEELQEIASENNKQTKEEKDGDAGGTIIENEEETKSHKYSNPLKQRSHLVLLAKNTQGLKSLFRITSDSSIEGSYFGYPRCDYDILQKHSRGNIIGLSACIGGHLAKPVFNNQLQPDHNLWVPNNDNFELIQELLAKEIAKFQEVLGKENYFVEIQWNRLGSQHLVNYHLIEASKRTGAPLVVTCDAHYSDPKHWREREIYKLMNPMFIKNAEENMKKLPQKIEDLKCELYPKNAQQVWDSYKEYGKNVYPEIYDDQLIKEAIERTHDIAFNIIEKNIDPDRKVKLPAISRIIQEDTLQALEKELVEKGEDVKDEDLIAFKELKKLAIQGLFFRKVHEKKEYIDRLKYELEVVKVLKFSKYFLVYNQIMKVNGEHMLLGAARGCLSGETYVLTKDSSYKQLKDLQIGEKVFTLSGNTNKIENKFEYDISEVLLKVKTQHSFDPTLLTKDHKVFGIKRKQTKEYSKAKNNKDKYKKYQDVDLTCGNWDEIENFSIGDLLYVPFPKGRKVYNFLSQFIDLSHYIEFHSEYNVTDDLIYNSHKEVSFSRILPIDDEFYYFLGRWVGDGWCLSGKKNYVGLAFNSDDKNGIEHFSNYFRKLNSEVSLRKHKTQKLIQMEIYSVPFVNFIRSLFPDYKNTSNTKYFGEFKYLPDEQLKILLKGYQDSDGHVRKNNSKECFDTTSLRLVLELREALLYLKIPSSVITRQPFYRGKYLCKTSYKIEFAGLSLENHSKFKTLDGYFTPIIKLSQESNIIKVYDIKVENEPCYLTSNFIVHNSSGGSLLCYLIGITQVDPIRFDLLFERFLTRKKINSFPDIDCLSDDSLILLPNYETIKLSDVKVGDEVLDGNNIPRKILNVRTRELKEDDKVYSIELDIINGRVDKDIPVNIIVNHKHRLFVLNLEKEEMYELKTVEKITEDDWLIGNDGIIAINKKELLIGKKRDKIRLIDITVDVSSTFQVLPFNINSKNLLNKDPIRVVSHNSDVSDREKAVKLIQEHFGVENVIPVSTFSMLKPLSLIKDLSKLYGFPFERVNHFTVNMIPEVMSVMKAEPGFDAQQYEMTFEHLEKHSPSFNAFMKYVGDAPGFKENLLVLFKQNRQIGTHAGGAIITEDSRNNLPLVKAKGGIQTPWPEGLAARHLEAFGFLKFDILGLSTLAVFEDVIRRIIKKETGKKFVPQAEINEWFYNHLHPDNNPLSDKVVYRNVYWNGNYANIFQFIKPNVQRFSKQMKPTSILDIAITTSIFRPGPMGIKISDTVNGAHNLYLENRLNPENIVYKHPLLKEVLGKNSGLIIFQEDLQLIYHKLAGIPLEDTDSVRKAFTKKDQSNKAKAEADREALKKDFIERCLLKNGIPVETSKAIFEEMEKFVAYSFNKCLWKNTTVEVLESDKSIVVKKIYEVKVGNKVNSKNGWVVVKDVIYQGKKELYKILTHRFDQEIVCTLDHKFETIGSGMMTAEELLLNYDSPDSGDINIVTKKGWDVLMTIADQSFIDDAYDLEVDHPDHTFYANGISVSNSHAIAYAITSYQCAFFLTYYPYEWVASYLDYAAAQGGNTKIQALMEVASLGYQMEKVDINTSDEEYRVIEKNGKPYVVPSFSGIKGVGTIALQEIKKFRPYQTVEDLLFNPDGSWRHSKFNKGALGNLIKTRSFASMDIIGPDKVFKNYKQMYRVLIEGFDVLKKTSERKKDNDARTLLKQKIEEVLNNHPEDWTNKEKQEFMEELTGAPDWSLLLTPKMTEYLTRAKIDSIDGYSDPYEFYWLIIDSYEVKVGKTNKPFIRIAFNGASGAKRYSKVWLNGKFEKNIPVYNKEEIYIGKFRQDDWGFNTVPDNLRKLTDHGEAGIAEQISSP